MKTVIYGQTVINFTPNPTGRCEKISFRGSGTVDEASFIIYQKLFRGEN
jgi:hypothetical protein